MRVVFFIDEYNHPYADRSVLTKKRGAVYPPRSAFLRCVFEIFDCVRQPANLGSDAARAVGECVAEGSTDTFATTDAVEETRLKDTRNAKRGRCEEDSQGRRWADNKILNHVLVTPSSFMESSIRLTCLYGPESRPSGEGACFSAFSTSNVD